MLVNYPRLNLARFALLVSALVAAPIDADTGGGAAAVLLLMLLV